MAVRLIYKDVAIGADEDAYVSTSAEVEPFSVISKIPFETETTAIATGELNGWGLIDDYKVFDNQTVAFWSKERSGEDCTFATPPTITLEFGQQYTVTGLTVYFAPAMMEYCTQMRAKFYRAEAIIHSTTYYPNSPKFIASDIAEAFDKLELVFEKTNLPGKRLKIEHIAMGVHREFGGDELTSANFLHEIDPIADTLPVNVLDASFHSNEAVDYVFQRKQPVEGYNGSELIGVYYIEHGRRTGARNYEIACSDILGVWDTEEYVGGFWSDDAPLTRILENVFGFRDLALFDISPEYAESTLRGIIMPGTKREALQQIAFALGAVIDTSGTKKVKLYPLPVGAGQTIPAANTYVGGAIEVNDKVTEVTVTAYVIFDERPNENQSYIEFNGVQYRYYTDTKHAYNDSTIASDRPNKIKFDKSYLVNLSNAQTLADNIMAHYKHREKYAFKHVMSGQNVGDRAGVTLPWGDVANGNITKMSMSVTGLAVSETEILLD